MLIMNKKPTVDVIVNIVEKFAIKKANSNCLGFLYEPKKPKKIVEK